MALGLCYRGHAYTGWQSQPDGRAVQDHVERALSRFADAPVRTVCAGRTDAGVHALNQVIHFDPPVQRDPFSWVRGPNASLPDDIAVQWAQPVEAAFHARNWARGRRYAYLLLESPVRPALDRHQVGWTFRPLDAQAMREGADRLLGTHDFSAFRSSQCQARSPVKELRELGIRRLGAYWRFDFEASAFLHHMVRNIMGCLVAIGSGVRTPQWLDEVLQSRDRSRAAPTFAADGLYFLGPAYDEHLGLPRRTAAFDWLPGAA
jgi:tRNA pseudouridine38-40 synthase